MHTKTVSELGLLIGKLSWFIFALFKVENRWKTMKKKKNPFRPPHNSFFFFKMEKYKCRARIFKNESLIRSDQSASKFMLVGVMPELLMTQWPYHSYIRTRFHTAYVKRIPWVGGNGMAYSLSERENERK